MVGFWSEDSLEGLALFSSPEKGEKLWKMYKNKIKQVCEDESEIEAIKTTDEYLKLINFYDTICKMPKE